MSATAGVASDERAPTAPAAIQNTVLVLVAMLDEANRWLWHRRRDYPPDVDVWDLRFHWHAERERQAG